VFLGFEDKPIVEQFTKAALKAELCNTSRCTSNTQLGVHRPKQVERTDSGLWVDGNGAPLLDNPNVFQYTTAPRYGLTQINHYALGAMESFLVKITRGKPNHTSDPIDLAYWSDRNFAEVEDESILRHQPPVADRLAQLKKDLEVNRLHLAGVDWRGARIRALLQTVEGHSIVARLRQLPPTQVPAMADQEMLLRELMKIKARERTRRTTN
jgi:hypothetical protein